MSEVMTRYGGKFEDGQDHPTTTTLKIDAKKSKTRRMRKKKSKYEEEFSRVD